MIATVGERETSWGSCPMHSGDEGRVINTNELRIRQAGEKSPGFCSRYQV